MRVDEPLDHHQFTVFRPRNFPISVASAGSTLPSAVLGQTLFEVQDVLGATARVVLDPRVVVLLLDEKGPRSIRVV